MAETVDVQAETIGVGTVLALLCYGYGTFVGETLFGVRARTLSMWVLAATFAALAALHYAYGRRDFAAGYAGAAVGFGAFLLGTVPWQTVTGLLLLVASGGYVAFATIRAGEDEEGREDERTAETES